VRGSSPDLYAPMMMQGEAMPTWSGALTERTMTWLEILGRLNPGVTRQQAQASLAALSEQIKQENPLNVDSDITLNDASRGQQYSLSEVTSPLVWLMVIVVLVLAVACANVANLLIARLPARRKEIAIRMAIGVGRARLVRQLLTESLLLATLGGALGLLVARWLADLRVSFLPQNLLVVDTTFDNRVLAFTLALSVLTGLIFGLVPALQSSEPDLVAALKDQATSSGGRARRLSLRHLLVVAQVALGLFVLVSAGLCVRSLQKLLSIDAGFEPARVLVMSLDVALNGYKEPQGRECYAQLSEPIAGLPGVESVSLGTTVPLGNGGMRRSVKVEGYEPPDGRPPVNFDMNMVGLNYFRTMGIALVRGRDFTPQDGDGAPSAYAWRWGPAGAMSCAWCSAKACG
jgi:predicted permease